MAKQKRTIRKGMASEITDYTNKYHFDFDTGNIVPNMSAMPRAIRNIRFEKNGNSMVAEIPMLAEGMAVNMKAEGAAVDWTGEYLARWDLDAIPGKQSMARAIYYWQTEPLVYKCNEMLTQMANGKYVIDCEDDDQEKLLNEWFNQAMGFSFREQWFREYFRTGFVCSLKTLIPYKPRDFNPDKIPQRSKEGNVDAPLIPASASLEDKEVAQSVAVANILAKYQKSHADYLDVIRTYQDAQKQFEQGEITDQALMDITNMVGDKQYKWHENMIPGAYIILDPMRIVMKGPRQMSWLREPYFMMTGDLIKTFTGPDKNQERILKLIPAEIAGQLKEGKWQIWLPPNIVNITYGDKQPYDIYPRPMISHAFSWLEQKRGLLELDATVARSIKERILKVTVGNDTYPCFEPENIQALAMVFNSPSRSLALFWNHTLELEWVEPDLSSLKDTNKFDYCDKMIRTVYGMTEILLGTSHGGGSSGGSSGSGSVVNFKGVEINVSAAQSKFIQFVEGEIRLIQKALGLGGDFHIRADKLNTMDPVEHAQVINQAVQNGVLDHQTALESQNHHFPTVKKRMDKIKKLQKKDGTGIFTPTPSANNMGPDKGLKTGGRPKKGAKTKSNKPSKPKPRVKAKAVKLPDGTSRMVVDVDVLEPEHQNDIAEYFMVDKSLVMSKAEFEKAHGQKVLFLNPWPKLTPGEFIGVIKESEVSKERAAVAAEAEVSAWKDANKGKYVTAHVRAKAANTAMANTIKTFAVDVEDYQARFNEAVEELKAQDPNIDRNDLELITAIRLAKSYAKIQKHNG